MDMLLMMGAGTGADVARPPFDSLTLAMLDTWQRGFPLTPRPFAEVGAAFGLDEREAISRLAAAQSHGIVGRIGAVVQPNTVGASTLAALAVPEERLEEVAAIVSAQPEVSHNYEREHELNLWFVITAADRDHVRAVLSRIREQTGLEPLDLQLVRGFHIDLGFALPGAAPGERWKKHLPHNAGDVPAQPVRVDDFDRRLLAAIEDGLPLLPRPYLAVATELETTEQAVIERLERLLQAGIIRRFGIVIRHRRLGFRANAMVVWNVADELVERAGKLLAREPGVTLCYERTRRPPRWPYNLFCMIHGRERQAVEARIAELATLLKRKLGQDIEHVPLFSRHCFKQTGARFSTQRRSAS